MTHEELTHRLQRHVKLRELRVLMAVAEHGSFRKAGQALHVTQPAVTAAIAELESALGVRLFDRTPQGVFPTIHGSSFIRRAVAVLGELRLAAEEIGIISSGSKGTLHLGAVPMPAAGIVPAALTRLLDEHPDVFVSALEASEAVLVDALRSRRIDLFISRQPLNPSDESLHFELIYEDPLCILASRSHPLAARKRIRFEQLMQEKWVLPPGESVFMDHIRRVLNKQGYPVPRHSLESLSIPVMYGMLLNAGFLSFATRSQYRFTPMRPLLADLKVELPEIAAPICVVTLRGMHLSPLGTRFVACVRELAAESSAANSI